MEELQEQLTKKERRFLRRQERELDNVRETRKRTVRRVIGWSATVLAIAGSVWGIVTLVQNTSGRVSASMLPVAVSDADIQTGNRQAAVTLVEYADFQCPACAAYHPLLEQLLKEFDGKMKFVYRYLPLSSIHQNANLSAYAAQAASKQGKFWEMHDMLYEDQSVWAESKNARDIFVGYAGTLGLNVAQFKKDIDASDVTAVVRDQTEAGTRSGLSSTPTFFLNGKKIANPQSYDDLRELIIQALAQNP